MSNTKMSTQSESRTLKTGIQKTKRKHLTADAYVSNHYIGKVATNFKKQQVNYSAYFLVSQRSVQSA